MNQTESSLEQLLSDMAEDIPPMPADFHEQWMNAVREEAKHTEKAVPASLSQWPKILSIAAVFVFLIGGTFIFRSTRKTILTESRPVNALSVPEAGMTGEVDPEEAISGEAGPEEDAGNMIFKAAGYAGEADFSGTAVSDGEVSARKETGETAEDVSSAGALMMDTAEETGKDEPAAEEPVTEAPETASANHHGIGGFFTDMGDFLLSVWPYLLIVAVPLVVAAGMKKFRKK